MALGRLRSPGAWVLLALALVTCAMLTGCSRADAHEGGTGYSLETVVPCDASAACKRLQRGGWARQADGPLTWTVSTRPKMKFSLAPVKGPLGLRMRLVGNIKPPELPVQVVEVFANGHKVAVWFVEAPDDFYATIPSHVVGGDGKLYLELWIPRAGRLPTSAPDEARRFGIGCYELEISKAASVAVSDSDLARALPPVPNG